MLKSVADQCLGVIYCPIMQTIISAQPIWQLKHKCAVSWLANEIIYKSK